MSNFCGKPQIKAVQAAGGAGSDTTAIHKDTASEISTIAEKTSPVSGDLLIIEDSEDSNNKKKVEIGNITTGLIADTTYYIDGTGGNDSNDGLSALTAKATLSGLLAILPNEINAVLTINIDNNVTETSNVLFSNFYGSGSIVINGTRTEVDTGIAITGQDNTASSSTYHSYLDASGESFTINAHRGQFLQITSGTGNGSTLYPIISNTATRIEGFSFPNTDGTSVAKIISMNSITLSSGDITFKNIYLPLTINNIDLSATNLYNYFENVDDLNINNCALKQINTSHTTATIQYCYLNAANFNFNYAQKLSNLNFSRCTFTSTDTFGYAMFVGSSSTATMNTCRFDNCWTALYGDDDGGSFIVTVSNTLFKGNTIAVQGNGSKVALSRYGTSYLNFINNGICIDLKGSEIKIGKAATCQGSGNTTDVKLDGGSRTATLANLNSDIEFVNILSGGTIGYMDNVAFEAVDPVEVLTINVANSTVGIGTTTPNSPLEIQSYVTASSGATAFNRVASFYSNNSSENQEVHLGVLPTNVDTILRFAGGDSSGTFGKGYFLQHDKANDKLHIGLNTGGNINTDSAKLTIDNSGQVGIGTDTPGSLLEVNGTVTTTDLNVSNSLTIGNSGATYNMEMKGAGNQFILMSDTSSSTQWIFGQSGANFFMKSLSSDGFFYFRDAASVDTMIIDNVNNKVGIKEGSPDYVLDVNGSFGFTPGTSVTPVDNGDVVIEATNNTTLTFKLKGSDGTVRSATLTLS